MAEKKPEKSPEDQHERFRTAIREMIDAGELNPIDADEAFEKLVSRSPLPDDEAARKSGL